MLPSPAELVYFLEVVHTLNISRAAERLGISQPSLSLAIKRLEDSVGTPLLIRSKGGVNLSRAGHNFAAKAKELLEGWERLRDGTLKQDTEVIGRYVIGCHPSVALYALSNLITPLLIEFSQCEISSTTGFPER
jgi:LysR family transcriptional regulator, cell division regulator